MSEMKCKRCGANENRIHGFCSMECETEWEYEDDIRDLTARIAELEAESERFTVHSDIERQDDKSPNDTQTQTIVYGKESEE